MSTNWKHISQVARETKEYIRKRKDGEVKSLRSGFPKLDACNIDGFEWGNTITIGGRPSVGKTAYSSRIIAGALVHNDYPFDILDFNWEMAASALLVRELSAILQKSYKYLLSADNNVLTEREYGELGELLDNRFAQLPIYYVETPETSREFEDTVKRFVDKAKKPVLVRVDHTILAKKSAQEAGQVEMLLNLMGAANNLKRQAPIIFLFLTQMNREFETRQEDGTQNAFPRQGDVYGGDAAAMYSESMILLNKPHKYGLEFYGDKGGGVIVEEDMLFAHVVKNRNAKPDLIIRYREDFEHMNLIEL